MRSSSSFARNAGLAGLGVAAAAALAVLALRKTRRLSLDGRVVLITGGSRGLGLVLARAFAARGARVALMARDSAEVRRAVADVTSRGGEALGVPGDVREAPDVERVVAEVEAAWGPIDVLVNNAGVIQAGPIEHMSEDDFRESLEVHFWGPLYAISSVLPGMRRRGTGRIVNVASVGGKVAIPHLVPYCVGKFALVALSDGLRAELAQHDIRVTTVAPGLMRTGSHLKARFKGRQNREFAWFAAAASSPGLAVSAERAARAIVDACERGAPSLTIGTPARALIAAEALAPGLAGEILATVDRFLPATTGPDGDRLRAGEDVGASPVLDWITSLGRAAAARNNEIDPARA